MNKKIRNSLFSALQKSYIFLVVLVTALIIGYEYHNSFISNPSLKEWQIEKFQQTFNKKESEISSIVSDIGNFISENPNEFEIRKRLFSYSNLFKKKGFIFYIYKNDTIAFWSNNQSDIPYTAYKNQFKDQPVDLGNAYYYSVEKDTVNYKVVGLVKIKNNYLIENKFLQNEFQKDFNLNSDAKISIYHCVNCNGIYNIGGSRVFSIDISDQSKETERYTKVYLYIVLACILLFGLFVYAFIKNIENLKIRKICIIFSIIIFVLLRLWLLIFAKVQLSSIFLFHPSLYASSDFLPSLGDLVLHVAFFIFIIVLVYNNYPLKLDNGKRKLNGQNHIFIFYIVLLFIFFIYLTIINIFSDLIFNSNISFEVYKVMDVNVYTLVSLACIVTLYFGIVLIFDKLMLLLIDIFEPKKLTRHLLFSFVILLIISLIFFKTDFIIVCQIVPSFLILTYFRIYRNSYTITGIIIISFVFTVFSVFFILNQVSQKQLSNKKALAVNLSTEHDYIAEMLLDNIGKKITKDDKVIGFISKNETDNANLKSYITTKFFSGYLSKYDIQVIFCNPYDSILIHPDNKYFHCYSFFDDYVENLGIEVPGTDFYFMNNINGKIGYFGTIILFDEKTNEEYSLFIELQAKYIPTELGYPELLLDAGQTKTSALKDYSYAKYNKDTLISQSGKFQYSLIENFKKTNEFETLVFEDYEHLVYFSNNENIIIISNPGLQPSDWLFTFSYLFLFFTLSILSFILIARLGSLKKIRALTFRIKMQLSMMMVLFISFIFIGGLTIYLSANQYKDKYYEFISEKLQSVHTELIHKLEFEPSLNSNWHNNSYESLDELLRKFSNVFYSDINLYDPSGNILASSRPEIFNNRLQGFKMNSQAFFELSEMNRSEFIHNEEIGSLNYLSGYIPFFNNQNKLLAYLNLPYFTRQKELTKEISNLVVAIINIYVLLFIITTALAFFMSEQITRPLRLIQQNFRQIKLDKLNEQITYTGKDEIAELINEYNRMVFELAKSAEKLAQNEREMAWREMAKQIAHEIKNPLTPMKLSIQQLQKSWKDKAENWNEQFSKVTATLIEQINALSSIANEFSNFAKMPNPKNEVVNIVEKIKNTVRLFLNTGNITFNVDFNGHNEINILADKEQILRVFVNLIKNAIQAIPESKNGTIDINAIKDNENNKVIIKITDNGRGIANEIRNKLFQPNFTTKTSGMGMGLAIVKKIVETSNGMIDFTTIPGNGTCFIITWPLYKV